MGRTKTLVIATVLTGVVAGTTSAQAADPSMILAAPEVFRRVPAAVEEFASGWYLRGDIGYRMNELGGARSTVTPPDPRDNTIDNAFVGGLGFGTKYGWLRADLTADYASRAKYNGTTITANDTHASVDAVVLLGNVYFDLGSWGGFTPYVGVGIGASHLWTRGLLSPATPPGGNVLDGTQWNLAWAAMAGASYQLSARMLVDAGYRYLNLGDASSGENTLHHQVVLKDLTAHEVRIGVRYLID